MVGEGAQMLLQTLQYLKQTTMDNIHQHRWIFVGGLILIENSRRLKLLTTAFYQRTQRTIATGEMVR